MTQSVRTSWVGCSLSTDVMHKSRFTWNHWWEWGPGLRHCMSAALLYVISCTLITNSDAACARGSYQTTWMTKVRPWTLQKNVDPLVEQQTCSTLCSDETRFLKTFLWRSSLFKSVVIMLETMHFAVIYHHCIMLQVTLAFAQLRVTVWVTSSGM
jgi:hypothetical protein